MSHCSRTLTRAQNSDSILDKYELARGYPFHQPSEAESRGLQTSLPTVPLLTTLHCLPWILPYATLVRAQLLIHNAFIRNPFSGAGDVVQQVKCTHPSKHKARGPISSPAETGCGSTCLFVLPALRRWSKEDQRCYPQLHNQMETSLGQPGNPSWRNREGGREGEREERKEEK